MINRFFISLFLSLGFYSSVAQNSTMVNQAPLLYNPSFAGATGKMRISGFGRVENRDNISFYQSNNSRIYNSNRTLREYSYYTNTNFLSFDNLDSKSGFGYGGFIYTSNSQVKTDNYVIAQGTVGPKYILKNKKGEVKFTFSPNIFLGYTFANGQANTYKYIYPNGQFFNGNTVSYETLTNFAIATPNNYTDKLETGLSFLLNNEKGFLGLTVSNNLVSVPIIKTTYTYLDQFDTVYIYRDASLNTGTYLGISYRNMDISTSTKTINPSFISLGLQVGRTIKFIKGSKFSITPVFTANFGIPYNRDYYISFQRATLNLTFTYDKYFIGGGTGNFNAIFLGYQHPKFRSALAFSYYKSANLSGNGYSTFLRLEASFSWFFKE